MRSAPSFRRPTVVPARYRRVVVPAARREQRGRAAESDTEQCQPPQRFPARDEAGSRSRPATSPRDSHATPSGDDRRRTAARVAGRPTFPVQTPGHRDVTETPSLAGPWYTPLSGVHVRVVAAAGDEHVPLGNGGAVGGSTGAIARSTRRARRGSRPSPSRRSRASSSRVQVSGHVARRDASTRRATRSRRARSPGRHRGRARALRTAVVRTVVDRARTPGPRTSIRPRPRPPPRFEPGSDLTSDRRELGVRRHVRRRSQELVELVVTTGAGEHFPAHRRRDCGARPVSTSDRP